MSSKSIAVLGTVCCDEIYRPGYKVQKAFGGLYYNIITLAQLMTDNDSIYPVCKIGEDDYDNIIKEFTRYKSIKLDFIRKYPGRNNTVTLKYYSDTERIECSTNLPEKYTIDELLPLPDAQLFLLNFVSGIEMNYNTFNALKKRLKMPMVVDMHSIFLGFRENGERFYRRHMNWKRWQETGEVVQMNRTEAELLAGGAFKDPDELETFGQHLLSKGTEVVIITLDIEGVLLIWQKEKKNYSEKIPVYKFGETLDPTGCGDIFSSAFSYKYMSGCDPLESCDFASRVAGVRAVQHSSGELHSLRDLLNKHGVN
ncbi:carbohydrate kinase family protein [candidate division KSB1 bacterium]